MANPIKDTLLSMPEDKRQEARNHLVNVLGQDTYNKIMSEGDTPSWQEDVPTDYTTQKPLPRSKWSVRQKAAFVGKHGRDTYESIPIV